MPYTTHLVLYGTKVRGEGVEERVDKFEISLSNTK
jgi:hypothetical protein